MISAILWAACGTAAITGLIFLSLGLYRPFVRRHLCFAAMMLFLALYLPLQQRFYSSTSIDLSVELTRLQLTLGILFMATYALFICDYTGWRPAKPWAWGIAAYVASAIVLNHLSPFGLYFSERPDTMNSFHFGGEEIHLIFGQSSWPTATFFIYEIFIAVSAIVLLFKRKPEKKLILIAAIIGLCSIGLDFYHDLVQGQWPYTAEYSAWTFAVLLSLELASDFRRKEIQLQNALDNTVMIRDQLNTPLQTLSLGLHLLASKGAIDSSLIGRLKSCVARLENLGSRLRADSDKQHSEKQP